MYLFDSTSMSKTEFSKKKKEKRIYRDDGSSFADMSAFRKFDVPNGQLGRRGTLKEQFQTYISAVRLMFLPMLAVLGIITVAYLILYFLL